MIPVLPGKKPLFGRRVILLDQTGSTNSVLKEWALQGAEEGTVVVAREQQAGRGRGQHRWNSPRDLGLYCSLLLRPALTASQSGVLALLLTLAVIKAIRRTAGISPGIKWPNDIMIAGRKVCGILVENHLNGQQMAFAVAGIGINVQQSLADFPLALRQNSTSLRLSSGRSVDKDEILLQLLHQMNLLYPSLADMKMRRTWVNTWQQHCQHMDQPIAITQGGHSAEGIFRGITPWGAARVQVASGEILQLESGEFSLREK
ncbi:MAG TPA: biotin--[acetyl-CoA-carboxylase] ligase [bacterium]|nr:biotin--[acetyl-CoA-carboxylase] ligase [bacterium]HPR87282.1 biotin--[acetyl-CoA-carboxylase] ligase [bacterium]